MAHKQISDAMTPEERERRRESCRKWYAKNGKEYARKWRAEHPESVARQNENRKAASRRYYERNKELVNARVRERRAADPERTYAYNRVATCRKYGLTPEDYARMYDIQDGRCAACGDPQDVLCIDHNHTTNVVRELLCARCNKAIGYIEHPLRPRWEAYLGRHADA